MTPSEQAAFDKMRDALEWLTGVLWPLNPADTSDGCYTNDPKELKAREALAAAKAVNHSEQQRDMVQTQHDFTEKYRADARAAIKAGGWHEAIRKCLPVAECFMGRDGEVINPAPLDTLIAGDDRAIAPLFVAAQPATDLLQDVAAYIGVGGYNGATPEQLADRIRAEFDRLQKPAQIPEGWQLVPVEPTVEMENAGRMIGWPTYPPTVFDIYKAMLSAAPTQEQSNG